MHPSQEPSHIQYLFQKALTTCLSMPDIRSWTPISALFIQHSHNRVKSTSLDIQEEEEEEKESVVALTGMSLFQNIEGFFSFTFQNGKGDRLH